MEFISTPYKVGIDAGVDALLHMGRYELGVIPDELQRPLVDDPFGSAANGWSAITQSICRPPIHIFARTADSWPNTTLP